eukprot:9231105-Ditylum_brightwellii.AAC.1
MWNDNDNERERQKQRRSLVNLGSGCEKLALYAALTCGGGGGGGGKDDDGDDDICCYYNVHGIEIGDILHNVDISSLYHAVDAGFFFLQLQQHRINPQQQHYNFI